MAASLPNFVTIPSELLQVAHACYTALRGAGLHCEHSEPHFPETASLYTNRRGEHRFYLVEARIKIERIDLWATFGRSCSSATFITLCVPDTATLDGKSVARARRLGVGLTVVAADGSMTEVALPADLSVNVSLPPLTGQAKKLRPHLTPIHDAISNGDWKRGFEDACKLAENTARNYLKRQVRNASPISIKNGAKTETLTLKKVSKMTLGQLADAFCNMLMPKYIDTFLCSSLKGINPDRISAAHGQLVGAKEKRLRRNIGKHMWTIHNLLKVVP